MLWQMLISLLNPLGGGQHGRPALCISTSFRCFPNKVSVRGAYKILSYTEKKCQLLSASRRPVFCGSVACGHLPSDAAGAAVVKATYQKL